MFQEQQHDSPLTPCLLLKGPALRPASSKRNKAGRKALAHPAPRGGSPQSRRGGRAPPGDGSAGLQASGVEGSFGTPLLPEFRSERRDPALTEVPGPHASLPGPRLPTPPPPRLSPSPRPAPGPLVAHLRLPAASTAPRRPTPGSSRSGGRASSAGHRRPKKSHPRSLRAAPKYETQA